MLRGVIFDMDGVIVDSHPTHRLAWRNFLLTVGKAVSEQDLDFILDGRKREEILRHFLGDLSAEQVEEYGNQKDDMLRVLEPAVAAVPGVLHLLGDLCDAGIKLGLATSANARRTQGTLQRLGIESCFSAIATGCDVDAGKPDPAIYRLVAERLALPPGDLLAVEDAVSGIQAARSAGMKCVAIATNGRREALLNAGALFVLPSFLDVTLSELRAPWNHEVARRSQSA